MPNYPIVGVNYQGNDRTKWAADKAYFKSIKQHDAKFPIRIMCSPAFIPRPFKILKSNGTNNYSYRLELVNYFASDPDFDVIFSAHYGPQTKRDWPLIRQSILDLAQYLQNTGLAIELQLGNELEGTYGIQFAKTSLTKSGSTATFVTSQTFNVQSGDTIYVYSYGGGGTYNYVGQKTVLTADGHNTTYYVDPSTPSSYNGVVYAYDTSPAELNQMIRDLATEVKQIYTLGPISYGALGNPNVNGVNPYDDWMANGIGGLDYLSTHVYPNATGRNPRIAPIAQKDIDIIQTLGTENVYVSEFNLSSSSINGLENRQGIRGMRMMFDKFQELGVKRAIIWSWDTNLNMHNSNGTLNKLWDVLIGRNGRIDRRISETRTSTNIRTIFTERTQ